MPVPLAACDCSPSMRRELEGHIHTLTRENEKLKKWNREYSSDLEKARKRIKYLEQYWYSGEEFIEFYTKWDKEVNELRKQVEKRDHLLRHYQDLWKEAVLQCQEQMEEDSAKIKALEEKVLRLNARLETDSRNSSLPVSRTPIGKKKPMPNSRQKTDRPRGGQEGHAKASLAGFEESEITETEAHTADICPECGSSSLEKGGEDIIKDETDCKVVLIKRRHRFYVYRCLCCGKTFHSPIPLHLKEKNQYGENLKALALSLTDQGYVSIGRTRDMIHGLCNGQIKPSEGYIAKLQKTASAALESFINDLYSHVEKHYFAWVKDFSLPVTNNLSERSLRGIKSKQKISGQFWSTENAGHYAKIQSYMETCRRNGISPHHAMVRLMNGNPYSVDELLGLSGA